MKSSLVFVMLVGLLVVTFPKFAECSEAFKVNADILSALKFEGPGSLADRKYLKLQDGQNFILPEVGARYIVIEIFSMYCPICQRDAQVVNQLHDLTLKIPGLGDKVKFIGIGVGNTPYEVSVFKKKFDVSFPLIADDNLIVQKAVSQSIRTPTFIVGRINGDRKLEILFTRVGAIKDAGEFLKELLSAAK